MRAENVKEWLRGVENEEKAAKKGESGYKGVGNTGAGRMAVGD